MIILTQYQLQSRSSEHVKNTSTNAFKQNNYNNFVCIRYNAMLLLIINTRVHLILCYLDEAKF